ncbi:hypothetical protein [Saccharomonospora piscinae]|uniref:hypothetical protein n=1 Tax=Saccharomonospora piscinae TaxID=687388 RepID=UPI0012DF70BC|nr:hypothetical protein [Saccharomonospora piscinae]
MSRPFDTLTLTPSPERRGRSMALAAVLSLLFVSASGFSNGLIAALVVGAVCAVGSGLLWGHLSRSRIVVTAEEVAVIGLVVRRRRSRDRVAGIVRAVLVPNQGPWIDTVFLLDSHREVVLRINGRHYAAQDLDRLMEVLQVPCAGPDRPVTAQQLHRLHPGLVLWIERRPLTFAFVVVAGLLVAAVVAGVIIAMSSGA